MISRQRESPWRASSKGFTIVEFMMATSVFGVVLLGVTAAILYMGQTYQSSIYASNTQAATVNLVDTVSQAIKFSSSQVASDNSGQTFSYCIGNRQFLYVKGRQLTDQTHPMSTQNAVMTRLSSNCQVDSIITGNVSGNPKELLGKGMRLLFLEVTSNSPGLYTVTARVAYGDNDLLCDPNVAGSCNPAGTLSLAQMWSRNVICKPGAGSQFCSVSELSNTVYRRL